jgi:hypothetical protein
MTTDYQNLVIIDKESGKQINFPPAENNVKSPPYFSGIGSSQDPIKFIEEFEKAAQWNNWRSDSRRKEIFLLCLTGQAERWAQRSILASDDYDAIPFNMDLVTETGTVFCLISRFKQKFVTEDWPDLYEQVYEERVQNVNESAKEYLESKRNLLFRADPKDEQRTESQKVREIIRGLRPEVQRLCISKTKDPFSPEAKNSLKTLKGLERLFRWADTQGATSNKLVNQSSQGIPPTQVHGGTMVQVNSLTQRVPGYLNGDSATGTRAHNEKVDSHSQVQNKILEKLEGMENNFALMADRITTIEKKCATMEQQRLPRCYNCSASDHYQRECPQPCKVCKKTDHRVGDCPTRSRTRRTQGVHVVEEECLDFQ